MTEPPLAGTERQALLRLGQLAASAPIAVLFDAMAEELARISDDDTGETFTVGSALCRFEPNGALTVLAGWGSALGVVPPIGTSLPLDGDSANARIHRTGRPARIDGHVTDSGTLSQRYVKFGAGSVVAVPIFVDDELWGSATVISQRPEPLPGTTESRLSEFAALASTAISSAQRRDEMLRLADEQAALRRVATLVATGAEPERVWDSVTAEVGRLCRAERAEMIHFDTPESIVFVSMWAPDGPHEDFPARWPLSQTTMSARLARDRVPVRVDDWSRIEGELAAAIRERVPIGGSVMAPVFTDGELWGAVVVDSAVGAVLERDTERRVVQFAELASTAMANATARAEVRRLADEQAVVGRVATLVARQAPLPEVWQTVADELIGLLPVEDVCVCRYEGDGTATVVGRAGVLTAVHPVGMRGPVDDDTAAGQVCRNQAVVRVDSYLEAVSVSGQAVREAGARSTVAYPIFAADRYWGWLSLTSVQPARVPADVAGSATRCIDLIATAIRNADAEDNLRASRERIVTEADNARRRFERDLHDGAQQRLVSLALELRESGGMDGAELDATADEVESILGDLRHLARGLHPAVLSEGGLPAAIRVLARRSTVPVVLTVPGPWAGMDEAIEIGGYYVVAEALTNVAKHARASTVEVTLAVSGGGIRITVADDGVGGARTVGGSGLVGITDRVEALGGSLSVVSPAGAGTTLIAELPASPSRTRPP